jgi:ribose transport system permease protein
MTIIGPLRIYVLLGLLILWTALGVPHFWGTANISGLLTQAVPNAIIVSGLTLVMIAGEIDLSVGSVMALASMVAIGLQQEIGAGGAAALALAAGGAIGAGNGLIVARTKIPSIVVTLGTMIAVQGVALAVNGGQDVTGTNLPLSLTMGQSVWWVVSPETLIAVGIALLLFVVGRWTRFGRNLYVIGGSDDRGKSCDINTGKHLVEVFALSGFTAALAGVALGLALSSGSAQFGTSTPLIVIAAAVVGGTSLIGGEGSVLGSNAAVLLLAAITTALDLIGAQTAIETLVTGAILVLVVLGDGYYIELRKKLRLVRLALAVRAPEVGPAGEI